LENDYINYSQIGLRFKLYLCEVLYNRAICSHRLDDAESMALDVNEARICATRSDQKKIIERAARTGVVENVVFGLPVSLFSYKNRIGVFLQYQRPRSETWTSRNTWASRQ
jgi:hypothetical protein